MKSGNRYLAFAVQGMSEVENVDNGSCKYCKKGCDGLLPEEIYGAPQRRDNNAITDRFPTIQISSISIRRFAVRPPSLLPRRFSLCLKGFACG